MIVLDTNVVSEGMRDHPNPVVVDWLDRNADEGLRLAAPVLAELRQGIERLPVSRNRSRLEDKFRAMTTMFRGDVLSFDADAAFAFGAMVGERERRGRPIGAFDAMIAAIARVHGADVATRDATDFAGLGLRLINPFAAG
ncbi:MAG: type II toxin-antitoxin system VapC family toxin [Bauldia sp.]|nr:type II toxin-antitoxin system VapC family toxin [Bauldia sp.]